MHSPLKITTIWVLGLFLVACGGSSPPAPEVDEDELAGAVKAVRAELDAAMIAEDLDAYLAHYMDDAVWLPPNAEEYIGKAAARQRLTSFFQSVNVEGESTVEEQVVMGPNWVGERGQFSIVLSPKQGDAESVHAVGSYLALWTKDTDGQWKIAIDMWNSDRGPSLAAPIEGSQ